MAVSQSLRLRRGAELEEEPPALRHGDARLPLRASPAALDVLKALRDGRLDPASLAPQPDLALMVSRLEASGWIARSVVSHGQTLATREPLSFLDVLTRRGLDPKVPVKLSRFAFLHVDRGEVVLESGTARSFVVSDDPRLAGLVAALAEPRAANDLDPEALGLARDELEAVLQLLIGAGVVLRLDSESDPELDEPALGQWDPVDLLFHARSRLGRRNPSYGGTYPHRGQFPEPQGIRPEAEDTVPLPRPDLDAVAASDPPLTQVIEQRRSIRDQDDDAPIDVWALGELLFRSARITQVLRDEHMSEPFPLRPYPSGGGLYELDVYPVVRLCHGVDPGLYLYDPVAHGLVLRSPPGPMVDGLLDSARVASLRETHPQVLLVITARFGRMNWKYEGVAYALVLKHVGVLYQTLYLVATAMGLAPCGLGGGDSDLFARAAGLDYSAETSVGELIVGSRPEKWTGIPQTS